MDPLTESYGIPFPNDDALRPFWVTFTFEDVAPIDCIVRARTMRDAERIARELIPGAASITVERPT